MHIKKIINMQENVNGMVNRIYLKTRTYLIYRTGSLKDLGVNRFCREKVAFAGNGGFGLNEMLGTAAAIIIAAFVIIPGLRTFAGVVISKLNTWWTSISTSIFPAS